MAHKAAAKYEKQKKDPELKKLTTDFLNSFQKSAASSEADLKRIMQSGSFSIFEGGAVELTDDVLEARRALVLKASKMLGAKVANEKQLGEIILSHGQNLIRQKPPLQDAVKNLIESMFSESEKEYVLNISNYIIKFEENVRSLQISRVKALFTSDLAKAFSKDTKGGRLIIQEAPTHAIEYENPIIFKMYGICWEVHTATSKANVYEEAKWLIDISLSFLRLSYKTQPHRFPEIGAIEPHPTSPEQNLNEGLIIGSEGWSFGGFRTPGIYLINKKTKKHIQSAKMAQKADLIFNPEEKSLAERVGQGLGWLTRGRQSKDRAERLLHFFTAIEALLSVDDKSAPVVQTIARHGAILLSKTIKHRPMAAAKIKELYAARSALVHAGSRNVLKSTADTVQLIAETMFIVVLSKCDLAMKHQDFCNYLSEASYGLKWPKK